MGNREHRLTIPAVISKIEEACEYVGKIAQDIGLDDDATYHCHLSVEEVLTNVIEHGYDYAGADKTIDIVCAVTANSFIITIIDEAEPFDPLSLPDPDPNTPLLERDSGGWGVFFVKKYMDHVSYRLDHNRNHFIMEKLLK